MGGWVREDEGATDLFALSVSISVFMYYFVCGQIQCDCRLFCWK